jgi:hypothetical protein
MTSGPPSWKYGLAMTRDIAGRVCERLTHGVLTEALSRNTLSTHEVQQPKLQEPRRPDGRGAERRP